ncbi:hypothetical protein [Bauldia litoralis]|uniref:Uncharacterized protein n=1 Tax=Bauldia litoralis TaxID=665467 RepID=A0A1G6BQ14_9HYPH|nr:hypothetical protein [Bauldia litoralis]SDB22732.1 hypothetical protein SAMN02982931_01714 [Bauldia litoralis]
MTSILASRSHSHDAPTPQYRPYRFTYCFNGTEWSVDIPALSLSEAKERVKVLGFARYEGEVSANHGRAERTERRTGAWFRKAMRSA